MRKFKSNDERVAFVAKTLLKEFKRGNDKLIDIEDCFCSVSSNAFNGVHTVFRHGYCEEVDFGELSSPDFGSITCKIADAICAKLKTKKSEFLYRDNREESVRHGTWYAGYTSHYKVCTKIILVRPCKGFLAINKKLKALGLPAINFRDWYYCDVGGKRSSVFSRSYSYYAENERMCDKVLAYLKGKKKVSYDFVDDDDLSDMERGERYETEWYGSESRKIRFMDAKGKRETIW
jgi:hypothetical protein